jgi:hypothetical protein
MGHRFVDSKRPFLITKLSLFKKGNAWAAKGMLNVATIIEKSGKNMTTQVSDLKGWVKEILNGTFTRLVLISALQLRR